MAVQGVGIYPNEQNEAIGWSKRVYPSDSAPTMYVRFGTQSAAWTKANVWITVEAVKKAGNEAINDYSLIGTAGALDVAIGSFTQVSGSNGEGYVWAYPFSSITGLSTLLGTLTYSSRTYDNIRITVEVRAFWSGGSEYGARQCFIGFIPEFVATDATWNSKGLEIAYTATGWGRPNDRFQVSSIGTDFPVVPYETTQYTGDTNTQYDCESSYVNSLTVDGKSEKWNQKFPSINVSYSSTDYSVSRTGYGEFTLTTTTELSSLPNDNVFWLPADSLPNGHVMALLDNSSVFGLRVKAKSAVSPAIFTGSGAGSNCAMVLDETVPAGTYTGKVALVDLTEIFGAGNEPATIADFQATDIYKAKLDAGELYDYDAGSLVSIENTNVVVPDLSPQTITATLRSAGTAKDQLQAGTISYTVSRKIGVAVIDGVNIKAVSFTQYSNNYRFNITGYDGAIKYSGASTNALCAEVPANYNGTVSLTANATEDVVFPYSSAILFTSTPSGSNCTTVAAMNTWFQSNNVTLFYELVTPTTDASTSLTTIELGSAFTIETELDSTFVLDAATEYGSSISDANYWSVIDEAGKLTIPADAFSVVPNTGNVLNGSIRMVGSWQPAGSVLNYMSLDGVVVTNLYDIKLPTLTAVVEGDGVRVTVGESNIGVTSIDKIQVQLVGSTLDEDRVTLSVDESYLFKAVPYNVPTQWQAVAYGTPSAGVEAASEAVFVTCARVYGFGVGVTAQDGSVVRIPYSTAYTSQSRPEAKRVKLQGRDRETVGFGEGGSVTWTISGKVVLDGFGARYGGASMEITDENELRNLPMKGACILRFDDGTRTKVQLTNVQIGRQIAGEMKRTVSISAQEVS